MKEQEINSINFIRERSEEIEKIEMAISSTKKKSMLFQRLPFYHRRRPKSYDSRLRKKRKLRKKNRHVLKTHTWYSKRFNMIKIMGCGIPLNRNIKSNKFIYKSQNRGFIFDESYKSVVVYKKPVNNIDGINYNIVDEVQIVNSNYGIFEAVVTKDYLAIILTEKIEIKDIVEHYKIDCCLSVIKKDSIFENNTNDEKYTKIINSMYSGDLNEAFANKLDVILKIKSRGNESGKILVKSQKIMNFWQNIVVCGIIPICINELQRLGLENDMMIYPFDYVTTDFYKEYEKALLEPIISKYNRTPKSKKMAYDTDLLYLYQEKKIFYGFFELEKGYLERGGVILNDNNDIIGRIIYGGFSYTKGKCKGLCYCFNTINEGEEYICKNLNSTVYNQIKITRVVGLSS